MNIGSILFVSDNSGAKRVCFIRQLYPYSMFDKIKTNGGDLILISVKKIIANNFFRLKKGTLYRAIIVLLNKNIRRSYGFIRFFNNSVVLLSKKGLPFATRILTPVMYELRLKKQMRIILLCINVF